MTRAETVIIGGGILGCAIAYFLARVGASDTLVIDRGSLCGEATAATAGGLGIQNKTPELIPTALRSLQLWQGLTEELGADVGYQRTGGFNVALTDDDLTHLTDLVAAQNADGAEIVLLTTRETRELLPALSPSISGASYAALDGFATPQLAGLAFATAAGAQGVTFWPGTAVEAITYDGDEYRLDTTRGPVRARRLVNAAGAWAGMVAAMLGVALPITPLVGHRVTLELDGDCLPYLVNHVRDNLSLKQHGPGTVMVGGGWEGRGNLVTGEKAAIAANVAGNLALAAAVMPALGRLRTKEVVLGWDATVADGLPLCGPWPELPNAFVIHAGRRGYSLGPLLARELAPVILGDPMPATLALFDPRRESLRVAARPPAALDRDGPATSIVDNEERSIRTAGASA